MNDLIVERSQETPEINFNSMTGVLKISGRAYSNDIKVFYKQMDSWLTEYLSEPAKITTIELQLEYYNSIFIKLLFQFFEKGKTVSLKGGKLNIIWLHQKDDEDSSDDAVRISRIINLPIQKVEFD